MQPTLDYTYRPLHPAGSIERMPRPDLRAKPFPKPHKTERKRTKWHPRHAARTAKAGAL